MFHRHFPNMKISSSSLERIYAKGKVKYKFINRIKKEIDFQNDHYKGLFDEMYTALKDA